MNKRILPPTAVPFLLVFLLAFTAGRASAQMFWNQAASFAGTSTSYVAIPNSPELNITGSFTIECWVNPDSTSGFRMLVNHRLGTASEGYAFYLNGGKPAIRTNSTTRLTGATAVSAGQWSHVAGTYEASTNTFTVFINGSFDTTMVHASAAPLSSSDSITIGVGFNSPFHGLMDEVRIWNRALAQTEIAENMRTSLGANSGVYGGLVLSTTFQDDESFGTLFSLTDWSGNGNTGYNRGVTAVDMNGNPPKYLAFNQSVQLDGADDYLAGPDNTNVSPTAAITLEAWVLPNVTGTGVLISKGTTAAYRILLLGTGNLLRAGVSGTYVSSTDSIPPGRWSHVAFTYVASSGAYAFYVNGRDAGSGIIAAGAITDNSDSLTIGGGQGLVDFHGFVDEVRISNYAKTEADIRQFLYVSMDDANEPYSGQVNVCYNLDGYTTDACAEPGPRLYFNGDAQFSAPSTVSNVPVSPLDRVAQTGFLNGFTMKTSDRRIPETGTSGNMLADSIYISQNTIISDVNLFVALNHTYDGDVDLTITGPGGATVDVCSDWFMLGQDDNIVTLFDDNADSAYADNSITSPGPHIKPENSLNTALSGTSALGWWILRIVDDLGGDTGRVYAWGVQINNQANVTDIVEVAGTPVEYGLDQNYPNPFNPVTTIAYSIGARGPVTLEIYDLLGRRVATLVNEEKSPGHYRASFDARSVASGTYFYRLTSRDFVQVRKMLLLR